MVVTEVRSYFRRIIGHTVTNSVNVHWISTKIGTFALIGPLSVPNFITTGLCVGVLWQILQSVREVEGKKQRNYSKILAARISEMSGAIFFNFGM